MAPRGGKRPGAGRPAGRRNKATDAELESLSTLAKQHTAAALQTLVNIAANSESDAARVAAANSILDRGYGKPTQALEHSGKGGAPLTPMIIFEAEDGK